ncbi:MAG: 50S ribosomal protein L11 methyltransferase [Sphingobacteriales bacterium]|nr:50S ribosomal protein L11 methyltransferase [Sphingobacteriales bacterium]
MSSHIQITFSNLQPEQQELLIAHLDEAGFEGFDESENVLKAFIPEKNYDKELLKEIAFKYQLSFEEKIIPEQNWNAVWESNFQPVIIDDFVAIRADFHEPVKHVQHEIIITPKMSFGTGHHASTELMMQQMRQVDFMDKSVFDFGTGTGILSILAEKLGADKVVAVDNDDWSIANAEENFHRNNCKRIQLLKADGLPDNQQFDIILANINKNVLLDNIRSLKSHLSANGSLLLSGLLTPDETDMLAETGKFSLILREKTSKDNWICLKFSH